MINGVHQWNERELYRVEERATIAENRVRRLESAIQDALTMLSVQNFQSSAKAHAENILQKALKQ